MRSCVKGTLFFNQEEFDNLVYKHLPLKEYKQFISELNAIRAEQVTEDDEGFLLPNRLGVLKIKKFYRPSGIFCRRSNKNIHYNIHTFSSFYRTYPYLNDIKYDSRFSIKKIKGKRKRIQKMAYKFTANRENISHKLKKIIINKEREYQE